MSEINPNEVDADLDRSNVVEESKTAGHGRRFVSKHGRFQIKANPTMEPMQAGTELAGDFDVAALAESVGEHTAREKVEEMMQALAPGISSVMLFGELEGGMSLAHIWFGPNLPLFSHSHPKYGDCLYYVAAGAIFLGRRRLGPGSTFFIPNGQPYKYSAGPHGAEVLEFRAGGGEANQPGMKIEERSLDAIQSIIDRAKANQPLWKCPKQIGDTGHEKPT